VLPETCRAVRCGRLWAHLTSTQIRMSEAGILTQRESVRHPQTMRRILIGCWLVVTAASADMGSIPLQRDVTVYEPNQRGDLLIAGAAKKQP
jgi:hypothetical protein